MREQEGRKLQTKTTKHCMRKSLSGKPDKFAIFKSFVQILLEFHKKSFDFFYVIWFEVQPSAQLIVQTVVEKDLQVVIQRLHVWLYKRLHMWLYKWLHMWLYKGYTCGYTNVLLSVRKCLSYLMMSMLSTTYTLSTSTPHSVPCFMVIQCNVM